MHVLTTARERSFELQFCPLEIEETCVPNENIVIFTPDRDAQNPIQVGQRSVLSFGLTTFAYLAQHCT